MAPAPRAITEQTLTVADDAAGKPSPAGTPEQQAAADEPEAPAADAEPEFADRTESKPREVAGAAPAEATPLPDQEILVMAEHVPSSDVPSAEAGPGDRPRAPDISPDPVPTGGGEGTSGAVATSGTSSALPGPASPDAPESQSAAGVGPTASASPGPRGGWIERADAAEPADEQEPSEPQRASAGTERTETVPLRAVVLQDDTNGTDRNARHESPALPDDPSRSQPRSIDPSVRQPAPSGDPASLRVPQAGPQGGEVSGIQAAIPVDGQGRAIIVRGADAASSADGPDPVPRQVAIEITRALEQDQTSIRIRLDPPELGEVDIRLEFHDLRLKASLSAERPDTLDLLQRDSRTLVRALRDAGLELASSDLSFAHHGRNDDRAARSYAQRAIGLTVSPAAAASLQDLSLMPARRDGFVSLHERRMDLRV